MWRKIPIIESFIAESRPDAIGFPETNLHLDKREVTPSINGYNWENIRSDHAERLSVLIKDGTNYIIVNTLNTSCNTVWIDFCSNDF